MKRVVSLIFACMLLFLFVACHESDPPSHTVPVSSEETTEPMQFDGKDFRIQYYNGGEYYVFGETDEPDTFSASVIERNQRVEKQHNVHLISCETMDNQTIVDIKKQYLSGEAEADLLTNSSGTLGSFLPSDCFGDWHDLPDLDLSAEHWHTEATRTMEIGGHAYAASGSAALVYYSNVYAILFRKDFVESSGVGDLYETVRQGDWTIETFVKTVRQTADINDSVYDSSRFGLVLGNTFGYDFDAFLYAGGVTSLKKEGDFFVYSPDFDAVATISEPLLDLALERNSVINPYRLQYSSIDLTTALSKGLAVMGGAPLGDVPSLRQAVTEGGLGLLPYPKASEEQTTYRSSVSIYQYDVLTYPANIPDPVLVAVVADSLCRESHNICLPVLVERAAGGNAEDAEMIRLIFEGRTAMPEHLIGVHLSLSSPIGDMRYHGYFNRRPNGANDIMYQLAAIELVTESWLQNLQEVWQEIWSAESTETTAMP